MRNSFFSHFWQQKVANTTSFFPPTLLLLLTPLLMLMGLAVSSFFATQAFAAPIGTVIALNPGVTVERQGQHLPLALKDSLELDDTIISDATGKAQIMFNDDTTVSIANNTTLSMNEFADTGSTPAFKGHIGQGLARIITGKVVEQNPDGFAITTPEATVGIRGTVLTVASSNGNTNVYVENTLHKEVYVNDTLVPQGQMATVNSPGEKPELNPITQQDQQMLEEESRIMEPTGAEEQTSSLPEMSASGPDSTLAETNLPQQQLGNIISADVGNIVAMVSGSLTPGPAGSIGSDPAATDFIGNFSFEVNLLSGQIYNATMSGHSALFALGNGTSYGLSGGTGRVQGSNFNISGFSGTIAYPVSAIPAAAGAGSFMNGSGDVRTTGGSVSGNYYIDSGPVTGWNLDQGTFNGVSNGGE